jgi:phosphoglycolate phosphatase
VADTLSALAARGVAMAVLTNKPQRLSDRLIAHFGLTHRFIGIIGGDTARGRKPDPAGLQALMEVAGAAAADTLVVGDSWVDLETARRAGTRACFARYGFGLLPREGLDECVAGIDSFPGVLALADGFGG